MYKGVPSFVWVMWLGLVGIELLVLMGMASEWQARPVAAGELAILGLLFVIIGLIIGGAAWLMFTYRRHYSSPLEDRHDTDFPAGGGA